MGPMISWVVALHTVLDTAEPVTLCWAAVIRSVKLWPDISAAPPPPLPLGSRRGLGPPSAGGPPPPLPPPAPSPPAGLGRGSGPRAATQPGKNRLLSPAGSGTIPGTPLPPPQLSPPLPWSAEAGQGKRDRQLQENGGARLLLGAFRAAPGHVTRAPPLLLRLPPLFPSLSSSTQALPRSAMEERGGARALRDETRLAGATGGSPAGGSARSAASRDAPCQQVARGWARWGHGGGGGAAGARGAGRGTYGFTLLSRQGCPSVCG